MPSWTEAGDRARPVSGPGAWGDAARDLLHLVRFRAGTVRRPARAVLGVAVVGGLTVAAILGPRSADSSSGEVADALEVLATGLDGRLPLVLVAAFVLALASSMGSGGGRELLSRSEAAIHPVSPVTEHLGALVLAPLNLAWLVQLWGALTVVAFVAPPGRLGGAVAVTVLWLLAATAAAQVVGWWVEGVRRLPRGVLAVRVTTVLVALMGLALHLAGRLDDVVRALPTTWVAGAMVGDAWVLAAVALAATAGLMVWLGGIPARWALGLPPREELRVDSGVHEARPAPEPRWLSPDTALLRRLDRGSVWRSVGMRRGLVVLGTGPGLVALVMGMPWGSVLMLPGLAASGAALLFVVNAWCLDGRGMVWRESLPVPPRSVFHARLLVAGECMLAVSAITLALAAVRAGLPDPATGVAVVTCWLVVVVQVLGASMSWSVRRPYGVDLSSPRATPAPHAAMAGYAARLSLSTTLTGMLFAGLAALGVWWLPLAVGAVFLAWSGTRLLRARRRWERAADRAVVALTVAAV